MSPRHGPRASPVVRKGARKYGSGPLGPRSRSAYRTFSRRWAQDPMVAGGGPWPCRPRQRPGRRVTGRFSGVHDWPDFGVHRGTRASAPNGASGSRRGSTSGRVPAGHESVGVSSLPGSRSHREAPVYRCCRVGRHSPTAGPDPRGIANLPRPSPHFQPVGSGRQWRCWADPAA